MKISIITVCFNSASTIVDALHSVAVQTYPDIEHLIIDGGSKDNTLSLIKEHGSHAAIVVSEKDAGIYDAMNKGLRLATGDVVGFLNSDDMLEHPDAIKCIAAGFSSSSLEAVYGDLVFVKPSDVSSVVRYWRPGAYIKGACTRGWMPPHPTFYVKRDLLMSIGGFDQQYKLQADFDLMLRLFEVRGMRSFYLNNTLARMRMGGATTGSLRNMIRGNLEAARSCRAQGFRGGLLFLFGKIGRRIPQFFSRPVDGQKI